MEKINLNEKTTVYLTNVAKSVKDGLRKEGQAIELHPKQAESWIASGKATKEAPKQVKAKGGQE